MLNFICGGLIGDFIQCLFAVKNICQIHQTKANLYVTDNPVFGGDRFIFPINKVYEDLLPVILQQPYIESFNIYQGQTNELINLNLFRKSPLLYHKCWTDFLQDTFKFQYQKPYQWVTINETNPTFDNMVIIHRSLKRQSPVFPWEKIVKENKGNIVFMSNNIHEYNNFPYKNDVPYHPVINLIDFYSAINSCRLFIGNQSSPYTLATSMDKLRSLELVDSCIDKFSSIGEENYSDKIIPVN